MNDNTWNKIESRLRDYLDLGSSYGENIRGLLNLIPIIKNDPVIQRSTPGVSLVNLIIRIPEKIPVIYIWCERPDLIYTIYIYDENGSRDYISINKDEVLKTLILYINKIQT
jgi:hypothetical protein